MPTNSAAYLTAPYADLTVAEAPYTSAATGELVIRARALAVNPLDEIKQSTGNVMYGWLPSPAVLGEDVAGEVVEVGAGVSGFAVGDRVIAYAVGMEKNRNHAAEGAFQLFTVVQAQLTARIPDDLSFENAVVLPLAISTAASALFQNDQLGLRHPNRTAQTDADANAAEWVVVWGGATSVGSNAIQLAVAAGYSVITTASPHNHDRMRALGARHVVDYRSGSAVREVVTLVDGRPVAGVLAIGTGSAEPALSIAVETGARRVSLASPSVSMSSLPRRRAPLALARFGLRMLSRTVPLMIRSRVRGIRTRFVWGSSLMTNEVGPMLWGRFLPEALAAGRYVTAPRAEVVGTGLESIQPALDALRRGASATKFVVTL
ncbi:zinc-binding alcohol dehydrogenase family protein [Agreia bicolorata]|uniref:Zn-dependent oxidoreductase n=1 Tax=Agreia bicolorata TaxID=110935 RepID=A0ABR5CJM0_9MICO|nr:zinc-binding alcohol dehydrogenase family protein [Agreia bicolorata]KJC65774.1 Zn-dependent oxidoreductase [Agreia bicolorata]